MNEESSEQSKDPLSSIKIITNLEDVAKEIMITEDERTETKIPLKITSYFLNVIKNDPTGNLRKTMIPSKEESLNLKGFSDPLGEEHDSVVKDTLVHRYPDRVLFLTTQVCFANCRFCTRSRVLNDPKQTRWKEAFEYIRNHNEIRDVILSGGDPLTLSNKKIKYLLDELNKIEHLEMLRIGTKTPVVNPKRIDNGLLEVLKSSIKPLYMNIHFTHPSEITEECKNACLSLANIGIPLGSQTVLLKGVNDTPETIKELYHKLLRIKVKPYILYQCDLVKGTEHFKTPLETGLNIIKSLRGFTSGLAIPHFVIDAPNGGGKIPILPNYVESYDGNKIILRNYEDKKFEYYW